MENLEVSEQYTKGFNHGYALKQHKPEILAGLKSPSNDKHPSDYVLGLKDGEQQFDRDLERGKVATKGKDMDQSKDLDMDIDTDR